MVSETHSAVSLGFSAVKDGDQSLLDTTTVWADRLIAIHSTEVFRFVDIKTFSTIEQNFTSGIIYVIFRVRTKVTTAHSALADIKKL